MEQFFSSLFSNENLMMYGIPFGIVLGGFIVGVIFQEVMLAKLKKWSAATPWQGDDVIVKSMDKIIPIWFFLLGVYADLLIFPFPKDIYSIVTDSVLIIFVLTLTVFVSRVSVGFIRIYANKSHGVLPATSIFVNLTRGVIYSLAVLIILSSFGISITPLLTALGVGGLAVALALQDTLSNLFAGLQLIASKKFRPGDYVELDDEAKGYIEDISWRNTTIRMLSNNLIILPNSKIASATITNYSRPEQDMSVYIHVGVNYDSDLEKVERVSLDVAKTVLEHVDGGKKDFQPLIRFNEFGTSSVNFTVILRVREYVDQYLLKHEFIKALHKRFDEERIDIPYPQTVVHMARKDGDDFNH